MIDCQHALRARDQHDDVGRAHIQPAGFAGILTVLLVAMTCAHSAAHAQQHEVSGTVIDYAAETALPGANVVVKGTTTGTTTNSAGHYELQAPTAGDTLVFSFIGFETQEIPIDGRSTLDVALVPETVVGEELVVIGYGTLRRRDVTGAVSSVSTEQITDIPTQSLQDALQGKIAGVQITPESGRPGDQPVVRIRGVGTLNNASPLYVVDGMLLDEISFLDPRNVESVDVLKDASATAIYGSRGANGVLLITTKQGSPGQNHVSISSYYGIQNVTNTVNMLSARQFAELANESAVNEGRAPIFENPEQFGDGFDWQDWLIQDGSPVQSHHIAASGGSENIRYNVSAGFFDQRGVIRKSDYSRLNLRVNNQYYISDFIDIGHNINFAYEDFQDESRGRDVVGLTNHTLQADPTTRPTDEEGDFMDTSVNGGRINPAATVGFNHNQNNSFRTTGNIYANVDVLHGFTFRSMFGLDWNRTDHRDYVPEYFVTPIQNTQDSRLNVSRGGSSNWLNENTLTYRGAIADHRVDVVGGITLQEFTSENLGASRLNVPASATDPLHELLYLNAGQTEGQTNFNTSTSWGMVSYLSRANYSFKDRYLFTATFRRDGSSRFARRHRWGNFPSAALGWVISNETFMEGMPAVDYLKLRGSWGRIGNDKIPTDAAIPTVTSNLNAVFGENQDIHRGAAITELANPDLRWESTEQIDVGLELALFDNRLSAEVDYYRRTTSDILVRVPIPNLVGVQTEPIVNAASVLNSGFEIRTSWQSDGPGFRYEIGLNGTTVRNEVLSLGGGREEIRAGGTRNIGETTITVPGHPIGSFFGWKQEGIFQTQEEIDNSATRGEEQPGDIKIADLNDDGVIDDDDRTILGSPIPDFYYGISLDLNFRAFDVSFDIDGQVGNKVLYARTVDRGYGLFNYEEFFLNRWTGPGTSNSEPRITDAGHNYAVTDRFLYDGDFLRLRNVQLGYTLPGSMLNQLSVRRLRLYVSATNVFTISDYPGYTPQIGGGSVIATGIDNGTYPVASTYTIGVQLDF